MRVMANLQLFSHAEDLHDAATSGLEHTLTQPLVAIPIYLILVNVIFMTLRHYKKSAVLPVLLAFNLIVGVVSYALVPAVSIMAITAGIVMALAVTLSLLSGN